MLLHCCFAHALACCTAIQLYLRTWCQPYGFVLGSYFVCCEIKLGESLRVSYDRPVCTKLCARIIWNDCGYVHMSYNIEENVIVWKYCMVGSYMEDSRIQQNSENWRVGTCTAHFGQYSTGVIGSTRWTHKCTKVVLISYHNISSGCIHKTTVLGWDMWWLL